MTNYTINQETGEKVYNSIDTMIDLHPTTKPKRRLKQPHELNKEAIRQILRELEQLVLERNKRYLC